MSSSVSLSPAEIAPAEGEAHGARLRLRLLAVLALAMLPLLAYLVVAAEASRHAALDWLEREMQDAAAQAAAREAEELALGGRLLQAVAEDMPAGAAATLCTALRPRLAAGPAGLAAVAVHLADASPACTGSLRDGAAPVLPAAHVRAALAAPGAVTLSGEPGQGLLLARTASLGGGETVVMTIALDPSHLPQLGLPLRRDQVSRLLVDPDDGFVLAAQPDHAGRAGRGVALPRLLGALRDGGAGAAVVRDGQGALRLAGHAPVPLEAAGVRFAGRATMLLELPYDSLLAEADARRREQWLTAAALAALGAGFAWLLARRWLERPLQAVLARRRVGDPSFQANSLAALRPAGTWLRQQGDLAAVVDASAEMFLRLDGALRVTYASPATRKLLGYAPAEVVDADLAREPGWEGCLAQIEALRRGEMAPPPCRLVARRRDDLEVMLEVRAIRLSDGGFMLACRDIGAEAALQHELEEARERLATLALSDRQTGLANRRRFDEALAQELGRAKRAQEPISLVLLRLEDWVGCAEKLGEAQAEAALRQIGGVLTGALRRPGDLAARLDEALFGVLLPTTDRIGAQRVAERLREAVTEAWRQLDYAGLAARIGAGSVLPLGEEDSAEGLVELAARALQEESAARGTALLTPRPAPAVPLPVSRAAEQAAEVQTAG